MLNIFLILILVPSFLQAMVGPNNNPLQTPETNNTFQAVVYPLNPIPLERDHELLCATDTIPSLKEVSIGQRNEPMIRFYGCNTHALQEDYTKAWSLWFEYNTKQLHGKKMVFDLLLLTYTLENIATKHRIVQSTKHENVQHFDQKTQQKLAAWCTKRYCPHQQTPFKRHPNTYSAKK